MLEVRSLCFDYQDKPLLNQVTFLLKAGQLLHLRGNNGAGKTTLLRLLAGLLYPLEGDIYFDGQSITENLGTYQQKLCFVGHRTGINPLLTVKENCFFDMHWGRQDVDFKHLLQQFGLKGLDQEICGHLSAGQRRRIGLLRLAMTNARLWLLDEPLVALDKDAIDFLMTSIENHLARGGLIVLTSHQNLPCRADYLEYGL
ncbi:cytochrome c biogenesis heme-transporting ATPase CcmA [Legionella hackeliae]|uniref:Cytochrome c biogenesis ATP-binding export protein CcmA n=1 Tax=Legionella hackeliae TaxID=449 RepID=A0A0A8UTC1_LEGHA|nr:cytochrome c biogenesis heme-transporting ATPase CcmA [Legionella hackeliae]KTD08911.1 heme exporter protein CcmA [Legionella hackeliae]CEK10342.1 Cytochrome c biogenesis ATP-binding export protein CcmA [Legionella hackeliae]STX47073.1 heme exporter protein CcmA [Legionella hackeliae]